MGQNLGTFDLRQTVTTLGGLAIEGYATGDVIQITQENDSYNREFGADGHTDRIKNNATALTITIQLRQTSPTNDKLSALFAADLASNKGILAFAFKDLNGNTVITAESAWIPRPADFVGGEEAKIREWIIHTGSAKVQFIGGNE
jgi:hypothetical protein